MVRDAQAVTARVQAVAPRRARRIHPETLFALVLVAPALLVVLAGC
ncbi:MAG: hypothetical protein QN130_14030 [Armatimonadota bacterium]|nr:hypothetical protein [Armatimonadota bacterium]